MILFESSEFRDKSTEFFGKWVHERKFEVGVLGEFEVALVTEGKEQLFDREMLELASRLVDFAKRSEARIRDLLFADYRRVLDRDPNWLDFCGVPRDLTIRSFLKHLRPTRWLRVSRDPFATQKHSSEIHLIPLWDTEHAFRLQVLNGSLVDVNGSSSKLRALEASVKMWS